MRAIESLLSDYKLDAYCRRAILCMSSSSHLICYDSEGALPDSNIGRLLMG